MGEGANQLSQDDERDDVVTVNEADIQQTREEMSETLQAIQAKLDPERMTDDAKEAAREMVEEVKESAQQISEAASAAAVEAVDHAVMKVQEAFPQLTEAASAAAMEAVDHAMMKVQEAFPGIARQAQEVAQATVDHAIGEAKMAIRELGNQTKAAVRDATVGRIERVAQSTSDTSKYLGSSTVSTIKQNPGPAAVAAFGLGWLLMNGRRGPQSTKPMTPSGMMGQSGITQSKVGQAQDVAGAAMDQVQSAASGVAGQVQNVATGAADHVEDTVVSIATKVQHAPGRVRQMIETSPVPMGVVAAAIGSVAAMSMASTRRENELLGEVRDNLVQQAQTTVQTTIEKVQHVAEEVGETISQEAEAEGLSMQS